MSGLTNKKIALVHDWLLGIGGAERVLKTFHEMFPEAPIFVLYRNKNFVKEFLPNAKIHTTFLQKLNWFGLHRVLALLLPMAVESFDFSDFDLVISTGVFTKGIITKPETTHVNYCSSPMRQVWDWNFEYGGGLFTRLAQHLLRIWDRLVSTRVDYFISNSKNTQRRIEKYYRRDSRVIYPPVKLERLVSQQLKNNSFNDYFLIVSRLFQHKNIDIAVKAFNKLQWPLVIVGDGPEREYLETIADKRYIVFCGLQSDEMTNVMYQACKAFIMPQEEDFGISAIEAMGHGKPVLALRRGGALEYIEEGKNGEFFDAPIEEVLADGVRRINNNPSKYDPGYIKDVARKFSAEFFTSQTIEFFSSVV